MRNPTLVTPHGRYIRVAELCKYTNNTAESSCLGCVHDYEPDDLNKPDPDPEAVRNQAGCRAIKAAYQEDHFLKHYPCKDSIWVYDTPESKAAYVAARLELAYT